MGIMDELEAEYRKKKLPEFGIGDTVDVGVRITEGDRQRVQVFNGTVIAIKGSGVKETFTVRRIVQGEGVERVFPMHSPRVENVKVRKRGRVRRAKLYYLRERVGKATRVKEKAWTKEEKKGAEASAPEATAEAPPEAGKQAKKEGKKLPAQRDMPTKITKEKGKETDTSS